MRLADALLPGPDVHPVISLYNAIDSRPKSAVELDMRDLFFALIPKLEVTRENRRNRNTGSFAVARTLFN